MSPGGGQQQQRRAIERGLQDGDPTARFVARAARYRVGDDEEISSLRALAGQVDGERLVQLARRWGVAGLVSETVDKLGDVLHIEHQVRLELVASRLQMLATNKRLMEVAASLCVEATRRGLALVPLKGAALLMKRPYDQLDLRPMVDVDLVGRPEQLDAVEALLVRSGLRRGPGFDHLLRHHHHVSYVGADGAAGSPPRLLLELHWSPFNALHCHNSRQDPMARLVSHSWQGAELAVFDAEDTLLSLLTHVATHRYRGPLKWLVDIDAVLRFLPLRQDVFWDRASAIGAQAAVFHVLALVGDFFDVSFARPAAAAAAPIRSRLLGAMGSSWSGFTDDGSATDDDGDVLAGALIHLLSHDRVADALRHVVYKASELAERSGGPRWPDVLVRGPAAAGARTRRR